MSYDTYDIHPDGSSGSHLDWKHLFATCHLQHATTSKPAILFVVKNKHRSNELSEEQHKIDKKWMRVALDLAREAVERGEVPVGAVAVKNGEVVGRGFNLKEAQQDPTAHAEMIALRETAVSVNNWRLLDVTLYCTLEPCPMCAGAMIQARLPRLVYGAKDTRFGAHGSIVNVLDAPDFNHHVAVTEGILQDEAIALLQQFFQQLRQKKG